MLRSYQKKTIELLYEWLKNNKGNPCIVLPTGSGKSWIIAELCRDALTKYPSTRILMLTHVKELIEQNAEKLLTLWKNAPLGIYSASLGKKQIDAITFASIQSIHNVDIQADLVIVDECHLISHKEEGNYRKLINRLGARVIGLTATPYRLGHGLITDKPAIFDDLIEPTSIEELQNQGYLAILRSKVTKEHFDLDGVHKRGCEYIESELQKAVDKDNDKVVSEIVKFGHDRRSWLVFCTGIAHAEHIRDEIRKYTTCEMITGKTNKSERERIIEEFRSGRIQAITNCDVLTTGFDAPNIDLIALLRPTLSTGLYVQMAGRGLRLKEHCKDCLVLDFAGVIQMHGAITDVRTPKKSEVGGVPPSKTCPECFEIIHASLRICPCCNHEFPVQEKPLFLRDDDIQSNLLEFEVKRWRWEKRISSKGNDMVVITYFGDELEKPIKEYLLLWSTGYALINSMNIYKTYAKIFGVKELHEFNSIVPKIKILYKMNKFVEIKDRIIEA